NAPVIEEKEVRALKKKPIFQRAIERLERLSSDPTTRRAYEASINEHRDHLAVLAAQLKVGEEIGLKKGEAKGLKKGEEIGLKKGEKKEQVKIARAMQKASFPNDQISKLTGLSIQEIENF